MMRTAMAAGVVAVLLFSGMALSAGKNANKKAGKAGEATLARFGDDIEKINETCTLTDAQKTKFEQAKALRDKEVEKFDADSAPKLEKIDERLAALASKPKDNLTPDVKKQIDEAKKQLEEMKAQFAARRESILQTHSRKMFTMLTADQRAKWNTPLLTDELMKEFSVVMLDGKQIDRLNAYAGQQARVQAFPIDRSPATEKLLNPLKLNVYRTILTPAQQAEYRKSKTPETPAKGGKAKAN